MTRAAQAVLRDALALPEPDRAEVAGTLLDSLEPAAEAGVEQAWREEVAARVAALDAGEIETVAWEDVRDRLLMKLSERRQN